MYPSSWGTLDSWIHYSFWEVNSSLGALASNLNEFPHLKHHFPQVWNFNKPEDVDLPCQKGVYPYSYINSFSKFEETSLPAKEAFHSDLTN